MLDILILLGLCCGHLVTVQSDHGIRMIMVMVVKVEELIKDLLERTLHLLGD